MLNIKTNAKNKTNDTPDEENGGRKKTPLWVLLVIFCISMMVATVMTFYRSNAPIEYTEISYTEFYAMIDEGTIDAVQMNSSMVNIDAKDGSHYTTQRVDDDTLTQKLLDAGIDITKEPASASGSSYIMAAVMLAFYALMLFYLFRMVNMNSRRKGTWLVKEDSNVRFSDVAGQEEAKASLTEVVDFLMNTKKYTKAGAKLPKGVLLVGPPGCGKTLLAKAVAGEAGVPFYSLSGSDFVEMYVGLGASRVRSLFKEAKKNAPCIIFIDEIDAIAKTRGISGSNEQEHTLNQLLTEMDGFSNNDGIVMLGATNRPEVLDSAFVRPGRFDRTIEVSLPDLFEREDILKVHMKDVRTAEKLNLHEVALQTPGASGADLAGMVNEAALNAVRCGREAVTQDDLLKSVETVLVGEEKQSRTLNDHEKKVVSIHETGHALVSAVLTKKQPVQKISIIPRTKGALGFVMQAPEEETYLQTSEEIKNQITVFMAGRAAEEICFGKEAVTTGAYDDLEKATSLARDMAGRFGLCGKFSSALKQNQRYLDSSMSRDCSETKSAWVDDTVDDMLQEAYDAALDILKNKEDELKELASYLYEHETITGEKFMDIMQSYESSHKIFDTEEADMEDVVVVT